MCFCLLGLFWVLGSCIIMTSLFWVFQETSIMFSAVAGLIYIPTSKVEHSPLLHIPASICCSHFWITAILIGKQGYLTAVLISISLMPSDAENLFSHIWYSLIFLVLRTVCWGLCPFLNWTVWSLLLSLLTCWHILNINLLSYK